MLVKNDFYFKFINEFKMVKHVGYKKIQHGFIVKLRIEGNNNELRSSVKRCNMATSKFRCERAFVLDIYHSVDKTIHVEKGYGLHDTKFLYTVGEYVNVKDYDKDVENVCSSGIHYFLSEEPAFYWNFDKSNYTGEWKDWYPNGQLQYHFFYKDGKLDGLAKIWCNNGQLLRQCFYTNGILNGESKEWNKNCALYIQKFYKNGELISQ